MHRDTLIVRKRRPTAPPDLPARVAVIEKANSNELKRIWQEELGIPPPPIRAYEFFRRMVAWRVQEKYLGGLSKEAREKLDRLVAQLDKDPKGTWLTDRIRPGVVLVREWKSVRHEVKALEDGFEYAGRQFASLSEIAREITGTRWSGPAFFGLRKPAKVRK